MGFSNTPIGPFQITDFAFATAAAKSSFDLGPMSRPIISSGISIASTTTVSIGASMGLGKDFAATVSTGRRIVLPSDSAFLSISRQ